MSDQSGLYQCSKALECKSQSCCHAVPHEVNGCDRAAPCGCWPGNSYFKPMVRCIPVEQVKPPSDCPHCGKKEAAGHHQMDCIQVLKGRIRDLEERLKSIEK